MTDGHDTASGRSRHEPPEAVLDRLIHRWAHSGPVVARLLRTTAKAWFDAA